MKRRNDNNLHIAYLGEWGFPKGFAAIQRQMLVSMGLVKQGCKVTILNFKGSHGPKVDFPVEGVFNGVHYQYTAGSIHRPDGFIGRNMQKIRGRLNELAALRQMKKRGELDIAIVSNRTFSLLCLYWVWLKLMRVPILLSSVELNSAIASKDGKWDQRLNDRLYEKYGYRMVDGVLPISNFLGEHSRQVAPKVPVQKAPIICDFDEFDLQREENGETQLVYCGSPSYFEVIRFVLEAFDQVHLTRDGVYMDLILGGGKSHEVERIQHKIAGMKHGDRVRLHRNISRQEVAQLYKNGAALLIPLRPTVQDEARFPHKLGEYLSSGNAVITTAIGEINHYPFIDGETAYVAAGYDTSLFAEKMQLVINDPMQARAIGQRGRDMGLTFFDYKKIGKDIWTFSCQILGVEVQEKTEQTISEVPVETIK